MLAGVAASAVPAVTWLVYRGTREIGRSQINAVRQEKSAAFCEELAAAGSDFLHVLKRLPGVDFGAREAMLDEAFSAVRSAYNGVTFWGSPSVISAADQLYACAERSERRALATAMARSAMSRLMETWCPGSEGLCDGNAEWCTSSRHWAAFRTHELMEDWGYLHDYERFDLRVELEDVLATSDILSDAELISIRGALNWTSVWRELRGPETRAEQQLRDALVVFVEGSRQGLAVV